MTVNLAGWKLTLPTGKKGSPDEYTGDALAKLKNSTWFERLPTGACRFRAAVNGVTTSGSKNPRSELREMNGSKGAAWSSSTGYHELSVTTGVTRLPNPRSDGDAAVVVAQIHDAKNDISVFRVEAGKVWVTKGNTTHHALAGSYVLGTPFEARYVVWKDQVQAFYNGKLITTIVGKFSGAYFKAGAYVQANTSNSKPGDASNYGEAVVYGLEVEHAEAPPKEQPPAEPPPAPQPEPAGRRTLLVIRHGEKDDNGDGTDDRPHALSDRGRKRASALAWLFTRDPNPLGLPKPDRLFASQGGRMVETLSKIADRLGLKISSQFDAEKQIQETAAWLRQQTGVTLACLEHKTLIAVVRALGLVVGTLPKVWPDDRFDMFLVLVSDDGGKSWTVRQVPEMLLLPGDSPRLL